MDDGIKVWQLEGLSKAITPYSRSLTAHNRKLDSRYYKQTGGEEREEEDY